MGRSSLQNIVSKFVSKKGFKNQSSKKLFWHKFNRTVCKRDHFINISNICCIAMKRSSLQKVTNFC
jgi:hypothetical protein